jgi:D-aminoacyl-tRNA deacylase
MRILIQRVAYASVEIGGKIHAKINTGLLILLGIEAADDAEDVDWLVKKVASMRIFSDSDGKMNQSVVEIGGDLLVVSQFTLHANTKKGNRPSFIRAARPEQSIPLYELFLQKLALESGQNVRSGVFGADMKVALVNDGPVTIWMDSKEKA